MFLYGADMISVNETYNARTQPLLVEELGYLPMYNVKKGDKKIVLKKEKELTQNLKFEWVRRSYQYEKSRLPMRV